jgi:hypothetical protein
MEQWQDQLIQDYLEQSGGDCLLDPKDMKLIYETPRYWLVIFEGGDGEFIDLVYKDKTKKVQTLEV